MLAVVDTGPLYAAVDADDQDHPRCVSVLQAEGTRLFIPAMVVAEACYLIGSRLGSSIEARFLAALASFAVVAPAPEDWDRIAELVERYHDFPIGGVDASVAALAERLNTNVIISLDRRHFSAIRPSRFSHWQLLPED